MAAPLSSSRVWAALKAEGCDVEGYRSWASHNRGNRGNGFRNLNGVMIHHTVSSGEMSSVALCYNGHSSLPGPLCHTVGGKSGKLYMVGWGRANHAGMGDPDVLRAIQREASSLPGDKRATVDGNGHFYGLEIVNLGNGRDVYTSKQYDAAVRWASALCRAHGWDQRSVLGHLEWQPGKIDPRGPVEGQGDFSMDRFRADVKERLSHSASWGGSTGSDGSSNTEGDNPMSGLHFLNVARQAPMKPKKGVKDAIEFDWEGADTGDYHYEPGGSQFASGKCQFWGSIDIEVKNLPVGEELQVRLSEVNKDTKKYVKDHKPAEVIGTGGRAFGRIPVDGYMLDKNKGMRVRVEHWSDGDVEVTAELKLHILDL